MHIGVVGAGNWGQNLVRNFCNLLGDENVSICDLDIHRLQRIKASHPSLTTTTDIHTMFLSNNISGVVIATPTSSHFEVAKHALQADKHVLIEKPMTSTSKQAQELIALAKKKNRLIMVDHLLMYHPAVHELKRLIDTGDLGNIYYLSSERLNLGVVRSDENALLSLAPHDIAIFLYLLNGKKITIVSATGGTYLQKEKGIEDVALLNLRFNDNTQTFSHFSWLDPHKVRKITVVGSKHMVIFDDMEPRNKLQIYDKSAEKQQSGKGFDVRYGNIVFPKVDLAEPLELMCRHFIQCIEEGKQPISDGNNGYKVVKILEAAQTSLKHNGQPVNIT